MLVSRDAELSLPEMVSRVAELNLPEMVSRVAELSLPEMVSPFQTVWWGVNPMSLKCCFTFPQ